MLDSTCGPPSSGVFVLDLPYDDTLLDMAGRTNTTSVSVLEDNLRDAIQQVTGLEDAVVDEQLTELHFGPLLLSGATVSYRPVAVTAVGGESILTALETALGEGDVAVNGGQALASEFQWCISRALMEHV